MEKCPQCGTDRQQDEQGNALGFCDGCGHKFTTSPEPQSQPESQSQSEPESLEEYEKEGNKDKYEATKMVIDITRTLYPELE